MGLDELKWLWQMSAPVCMEGEKGSRKHILGGLRILKRRFSYVMKGAPLIKYLQAFMHPRAGSALQHALELRPELAGVVVWPYICTSWNAKTRLQRIDEHFKVIDSRGVKLDFSIKDQLLLLDLANIATNLKVVLDHARWFMREGMLVLNLYVQDVRIYSLAFSFAHEDGNVVAYIGAIQGVSNEGIMTDYKEITKVLHGMRPRDFQVELFRIFCRCFGVTKIYAVNDDKRQHRSSYFGPEKSEDLFVDYNTIWEERGGVPDSDDFFVLAIETPMKNLNEVSSKKRAMYRRRYELLQSIDEWMKAFFNSHLASKRTDFPIVQGVSEI